jgi:hypothetical protein
VMALGRSGNSTDEMQQWWLHLVHHRAASKKVTFFYHTTHHHHSPGAEGKCFTYRTEPNMLWYCGVVMSGEDAPRPCLENLIVLEIKTNKQTSICLGFQYERVSCCALSDSLTLRLFLSTSILLHRSLSLSPLPPPFFLLSCFC